MLLLIEENGIIVNHDRGVLTGTTRPEIRRHGGEGARVNIRSFSIVQLAKMRNRKPGKRRQQRWDNGLDKMDESLLSNSNIPLNLDFENNTSLSEIFNDLLCQEMFLSVISYPQNNNKRNTSIDLDHHYSLNEMKKRLNKSSFEKLKNYYDAPFIKQVEEYLRLMIINGIGSPVVNDYNFEDELKNVLSELPSFHISNNDKQYLVLSFTDSFCRVLVHYLCEFYDILCNSDLIINNNQVKNRSNKVLYIRPKYVYKFHDLPRFGDCI